MRTAEWIDNLAKMCENRFRKERFTEAKIFPNLFAKHLTKRFQFFFGMEF